MKPEIKKLLILNAPYLLFVYLIDKAGAAVKNVLVPRILWLLRAAVHGEPFRLRKRDIVLKYRVYVRLYVLCRSPAGRAVFNARVPD